jgi:hypothetical protein
MTGTVTHRISVLFALAGLGVGASARAATGPAELLMSSLEYAVSAGQHPAMRSIALVIRDHNALAAGKRPLLCLRYEKAIRQGRPRSKGVVDMVLELMRTSGTVELLRADRVRVRDDSAMACGTPEVTLSLGDVLYATFRFRRMARLRPGEEPRVRIDVLPDTEEARSGAQVAEGGVSALETAPLIVLGAVQYRPSRPLSHARRSTVSFVVTDERFVHPFGQRLCAVYFRSLHDERQPGAGVAVVEMDVRRGGQPPVRLARGRIRVRDHVGGHCRSFVNELEVGDVLSARFRLKRMPRVESGDRYNVSLQLYP